jgi:hypothetical protein
VIASELSWPVALVGAVILAPALCGCEEPSDEPFDAGATPVVQHDSPCDGGCRHPPDPPAGAPEGDGPGQTFAFTTIEMGSPDTFDDWKDLGYDIDDKRTDSTSKDRCALGPHAPIYAIEDGDDGIDNSFVRNVVPFLPTKLQVEASSAPSEGKQTTLLEIRGLGAGSDYLNLQAALFSSGARLDQDGGAVPPAWDGTDEWPVHCERMLLCYDSNTPQLPANASKDVFPSSYVTSRVWVSGPRAQAPRIALSLWVEGYPLQLTLYRPVITANLAEGNPPTAAVDGVISGILNTEELTDSFLRIGAKLYTDFCRSDYQATFADQIRIASDILVDGTQDPARTCDGISLGLGFQLSAAKVGRVLDSTLPLDPPCDASAR